MSDDRTVHGLTALGNEIVRYDRAGKWYVESVNGKRWQVTVKEAAFAARNGTAFLGRTGGTLFDKRVSDDDPRVQRAGYLLSGLEGEEAKILHDLIGMVGELDRQVEASAHLYRDIQQVVRRLSDRVKAIETERLDRQG